MEFSKIDYNNGILNLEMEDEVRESSIRIIERCMEKGNKIIVPKKIEFEIIEDKNSIINLIDIKDKLCQGEVWDFYLYKYNENKYERLTMENNKSFQADYFQVENKLKEIKPYVTGDNKLSVFCRKTIDNIKCITVTEFETNKVKLNLEDIKLSIKN
ncbi:MAG: hypothetical protein ACRC7N_20920, partial [Clostridium sp.]